MLPEWWNALLGGVLIGIAASLMLLFNGRVTGISGILYGAWKFEKNDRAWRILFLIGLIVGGFLLRGIYPQAFTDRLDLSAGVLIMAGILVGFGTLLGSGCTSGHGVCGISRLSVRSIFATITFILAGVLGVFIFKLWGILP